MNIAVLRKRSLLYVLIFFSGFSLQSVAVENAEIVAGIDELLSPRYQTWLSESQVFSVSVQALCVETEKESAAISKSLAAAHLDWNKLRAQWAQISALSMGPLLQNNVNMQVQYWPDKKNLVAYQMQRYFKQQHLKQQFETVDLSRVSVALRGLSAAEYLLFDEGINWLALEQQQQYCPMLQAIADYHQHLAETTKAQWLLFLKTAVSDPMIDLRTELLRAQVSSIELQHKKLMAVIGKQPPQLYQAEYWRSQRSLDNLADIMQMQQQVWSQVWRKQLNTELPWVGLMDLHYRELNAGLQMITETSPVTLNTLLQTEDGLQQLQVIAGHLKALQGLTSQELAAVLNVQIGFNANDGD